MKAMIYTEYGEPEVLHLKDVEKPTPKNNEICVKVHATSVTTGDCNIRNFVFVPHGFTFMSRLVFGFNKPKKQILGLEFAGIVDTVGAEVTRFKPGDEVFGLAGVRMGSYAEYNCLPETVGVTLKPANLSFLDAVSIPNGALTALTFLRKIGKIKSGQKVLINGASGSIGSYAVQLAKYFGAEVTGVCSGKNVELVKSLGADHVIDYTKEDFTKRHKTYDMILDTVGKSPFLKSRPALKSGGVYLSAAAGIREFWQALWTSFASSEKVKVGMSSESQEDLIFLKQLVEEGHLKPVVDRCYPFEALPEAHRYVDAGHKKGNVVIEVIPA